MSFTSRPIILKTAIAMLFIAASTQGFAQQTDIRNLQANGANATQQNVGVFIDDYLNTNNASAGSYSGAERELFDICSDYATQASDASSAQEFSDLFVVLDFVAHEEAGAVGAGFTDTGHEQIASVLGRLQYLRSGTPGLASDGTLQLFSGGAAGADFSKLSYYANLSYGDGDKGRTRNEQGFDFDSQALTFGADYRYADDIVAGAALSLGQSDVDIDNNLGGTESDSIGLTFYGSYYRDNWYVDASLGFSQHDYDNVRNLPLAALMLMSMATDQVLRSSTDGDAINWSLGGGYTDTLKGWNANYSFRLDGVDASIDGYTESGGSLALNVGKQDVDSLQAVLAAQFSKAYSTDWGVASPYAGIELHKEFEDETRVVTASYRFDRFGNQFGFNSDDADDTYFLVSVGSSLVLAHGRQLFVNLDHVAGLSDVDSNTLTAGIRFEL